MAKHIIISFLIVVFFLSCDEKKQEVKYNDVDIKKSKKPLELKNELDTILEENNPQNINLDEHQLFIDTVRTSSFYKLFRDWSREIPESRNEHIHQEGDKLLKKIAKISFPKKLIKIRKIQGDYILYDRCDGNEPLYEIKENTVIYHGVHESLVAVINDIKKVDKNSLEIELILPFREDTASSNIGTLTIDRTIEKSIYEVSLQGKLADFNDYVISVEEIDNYDLLVNNCPQAKVIEYNDFEEINLPKLHNNYGPSKSSKQRSCLKKIS